MLSFKKNFCVVGSSGELCFCTTGSVEWSVTGLCNSPSQTFIFRQQSRLVIFNFSDFWKTNLGLFGHIQTFMLSEIRNSFSVCHRLLDMRVLFVQFCLLPNYVEIESWNTRVFYITRYVGIYRRWNACKFTTWMQIKHLSCCSVHVVFPLKRRKLILATALWKPTHSIELRVYFCISNEIKKKKKVPVFLSLAQSKSRLQNGSPDGCKSWSTHHHHKGPV